MTQNKDIRWWNFKHFVRSPRKLGKKFTHFDWAYVSRWVGSTTILEEKGCFDKPPARDDRIPASHQAGGWDHDDHARRRWGVETSCNRKSWGFLPRSLNCWPLKRVPGFRRERVFPHLRKKSLHPVLGIKCPDPEDSSKKSWFSFREGIKY